MTLDKAVNIAVTQEATNNQLQDIRGSQVTEVDVLKDGPYTGQPSAQGNQAKDKRCGNCGNFHNLTRRSLCPAYGTRCETCGKFNHWKSICHSHYRVKQPGQEQSKDRPQKKRENIHAIDTAEQNAETPPTENTTPRLMATPQLYFHSLYINSVSENDTRALLQLQVDSGQIIAPLLCKTDMGAGSNIIPVDPYKCLCPQSSYNSIENNNNIIATFGGHIIPHYGTCELILLHHGHSKSYAFHGVHTIGLQSWASQPVVIGNLSPLTMVWQQQRPELRLRWTHRGMQLQSQNFFARIKTASRELGVSRENFVSP